jgi:VanZ family protein
VWSWAAVYLALGVIPRVPSVPLLSAWERADLLVHGLATALLAALAAVWFREGRKTVINWPARAAGLAFGLGAAIELIQTRLPDRGFEMADLGADLVGALIGVGLHVLAVRTGTHRLTAALTVTGGAVATVAIGSYLFVETLVS